MADARPIVPASSISAMCCCGADLWRFDLPDCYRVLAAKKLRQIEPGGANPPKS